MYVDDYFNTGHEDDPVGELSPIEKFMRGVCSECGFNEKHNIEGKTDQEGKIELQSHHIGNHSDCKGALTFSTFYN